jgi:hypothetical protein
MSTLRTVMTTGRSQASITDHEYLVLAFMVAGDTMAHESE